MKVSGHQEDQARKAKSVKKAKIKAILITKISYHKYLKNNLKIVNMDNRNFALTH